MKCEICNREFEAVSPAARYCGTNCRSTAYRARLQLAARAGLRVQPERRTGETVQRAEGDDEGLPPRSFGAGADEKQSLRSQEAPTTDRREPRAAWSAAAAPAKATALRPSDEPSAAVRALAETLVKRKLAPLQQAIEDLQRKAERQTAEHEAALKKERKKNKKLRKKLARSWWGDAGPIPSWLVPALAAGGGGLLVNLLTKTDGKKIGTWLADVLSSTPQTPNAGDGARAGQVTLAQLIQERFVDSTQVHGRTRGQAPSNPATQGRHSDEESEHRSASESATEGDAKQSAAPEAEAGQSASSTQEAVPAPNTADPDLPESCVPWVLPRDEAANLLTELIGARRQGEYFWTGKFDWMRPLAARLVASVEPSLVWERKRGSVWSAAWFLYRAAMSLLQLVQRIEHAAKAQLPFKGLPITPTTLTLMDAVRELQERLRSHLCGIQNRLELTFETPTELLHAATRIESAVKRNRPSADDRLACALHDALVDIHGLILRTHDDERYQLATQPGGAPVEDSTIVENRHDVEARSDEIEALRPTAWALEHYGPPPGQKKAPPPMQPGVTADSGDQLASDPGLGSTDPREADVAGGSTKAAEKQSADDESRAADTRQDSQTDDDSKGFGQADRLCPEEDDINDADEAGGRELLSETRREPDAAGNSEGSGRADGADGFGVVDNGSDDDPADEEQGEVSEDLFSDDDDALADDPEADEHAD